MDESSLIELLDATARSDRQVVFMSGDRAEASSWGQVLQRARAVAESLRRCGCGPGRPVAVAEQTSETMVAVILGALLAEAPVAVLPAGRHERTPAKLRSYLDVLRPQVLVADPSVSADAAIVVESAALAAGFEPPTGVTTSDATCPRGCAVIQFTSGSTATPRAVLVSPDGIRANVAALAGAMDVRPASDVVVSWLPLFHDMGLIGQLLLSALTGSGLVLGSPTDFVLAPQRWLRWISDYRGTISLAPNSAYAALLGRRITGEMDLSSWRFAGIGGEQVDSRIIRTFGDAMAPLGFDPRALTPGYGLAEATLVVTVGPREQTLLSVTVDDEKLGRAGVAVPTSHGTELALLGEPVAGFQLRVVRDDNVACSEREVGEIQVRGPSVTHGYLDDPEGTANLFVDGWLRTGDTGFMIDGQLAIVGRLKDLIIIGGRNYAPERIEGAAMVCPGVRRGCVIAFGVPSRGTEGLVVVAEPAADQLSGDDISRLTKEVTASVYEELHIRVERVVLLRRGALPKTSSGKLQRSRCRHQFLTGDLERLALDTEERS